METQSPRRWPIPVRFSHWSNGWRHAAALALVIALGILAALPFLTRGVSQAFDTPIHLARLGALFDALQRGELYPRWLPDLLLGHGYPLFNYYAPLAYYVAAAWLHLGATAHNGYALAYVTFLLVGGVGMYWWAHDVYGRKSAAILAASAYLFSPYLLMNTYVRGSFAEVCAQAMLPWVFWAFRRLVLAEQPARYVPLAALTLAALAVSHTITLLFAPVVLASYLLVLLWQSGFARPKVWGVASALLLAMGISAFYWLPLILERSYVSEVAYAIARDGWLPVNVWRWDNFWQRTIPYVYNDNDAPGPMQVSVVQVGLAAVGFVVAFSLAHRTPHPKLLRAEFGLLLGVLLVAGASVGVWALPLWQSHRIFAIVQFPWRLLVVMSLPLTMAVGAFVLITERAWLRAGGTLALVMLVVWAHYPRLDLISFFDDASLAITPDHVAQIEQYKGAEEGGEKTSSVQEFKPRWASPELVWNAANEAPPVAPLNADQLTVVADNGWRKVVEVATSQPATLRFNDFYFPGWEVERTPTLKPLYASTNLGLLTVELAAGTYQLTLVWRGTWVQRVAGWLTVVALTLLVVWCWRTGLRRVWLAVSGLLLLAALTAAFYQPPSATVQQPMQRLAAAGIELEGLRYVQRAADTLELYPTWYVHAPLSARLEVRWLLVDGQGGVVAEWLGQPFYNSYSADNFPTATLIDDAYRLALPAGLAAGQYQLRGQVIGEDGASPLVAVLAVALPQATTGRATPSHPLAVQFEDGLALDGYDVRTGEVVERAAAADELLVVESGDKVEYTLWWRAMPAPHENFHGFIHLVDHVGGSVEQVDQIPGPLFQPPVLWDGTQPVPDVYALHIPERAPSGLYTPWVGIYRFPSENRLQIMDGETARDHVALAPIKVIHPAVDMAHASRVRVKIGDFAEWVGYDLTVPAPLLPGQSVTLTLYYRGVTPASLDYTRFIHVPHPAGGLLTQQDAIPQGGANPTWTWQPGEIIVDPVTILFPPDTPPGEYALLLGFYAPAAGGVRAALQSDEVGRVQAGEVATIVRVKVGE